MPALFSRRLAPRTLVCLLSAVAFAQAASAATVAPGKVENSSLDAQLFYQLLIGEIELRSGEAGNAFEVLLDAARRSKDEQLFRRATDVALQARAGDQALTAAKAWRTSLPESQEALRYVVQLLVTLNRSADALEPMRALPKGASKSPFPIPAEMAPAAEFEPKSAHVHIVAALGPAPVAVDEIIRSCQFSPAIVTAVLLELELAGRLERHPGNRVSLIHLP